MKHERWDNYRHWELEGHLDQGQDPHRKFLVPKYSLPCNYLYNSQHVNDLRNEMDIPG